MQAMERADLAAIADLLAADIRATMPPYSLWFQGRDAVLASMTESWDTATPHYVGQFRVLRVGANRQPAVAAYVRGPDASVFRAFALVVLGIESGRIAEFTAFHDADLFGAFALPTELPAPHR